MSFAGAEKTPIQSTAVCTQTDVSWVGAQPVTWNQRPAASVTSRPVPSVSGSVGTPTRGADVQKPVAQQGQHLRRKIKHQTNLLHQRFHLFMNLMPILLLKLIKGKVRRVPL